MTFATSSLLEPDGSQSIAGAARWVEQALLGTTATLIAILAVAAIGFLMISGRLPARRAVSVILGCFVLFGAATIATGLMGLRSGYEASEGANSVPATPPAQIPSPAPPAQPQVYDPYAGASVPNT
ncbi:TrbC/VirB2 family protein [Sphingomonas adhaesiva]|uniref:TrbC/VirB2 family protein n=1 Tax=Sphingomonas adhaesiva TaxID=28212 RepID=UPI002FF7FA5F